MFIRVQAKSKKWMCPACGYVIDRACGTRTGVVGVPAPFRGNRPGRGVKKHPYSSSADGRFFIDKGECVSIIGLNGLRGAGFHISLHT